MAVSISIGITQNQRLIASNESDVTVTITAKWTGGSYNTLQKSGWLKIDGVKYDFTSSFNTGRTTSGSEVIFEKKNIKVSHKSDGTKTLACSASYTSGVSSGTVTASASKALVAIPRTSTLSASNGTLGTAQTLTVTRQSTSFTHSIKAVCGDITVYIKSDGTTQATESIHSGTSINFTPPYSFASQNTTGLNVPVTFTITTYNGNDSLGSTTKAITCYIPDNKETNPTVSLSVTDDTGFLSTYGSYIQNKSKFEIAVTASGKQGADIKSYTTTVDEKTYTDSSFITGVISNKGTLTITTTVTDSRGRKATDTKTVTVLEYSPPVVENLLVYRADSNGNADKNGSSLRVEFDAKVYPLNNKNTATYYLKYRKVGTTNYTQLPINSLNNEYNPNGFYLAFSADKSSSYDVAILVKDNFEEIEKFSTGQTTIKLWSVLAKGLGFAFGKIAEIKNALDVAWNLIARKNIYMGYYHDEEKNIFLKNNAAHTGKTANPTNKVYPHNSKFYGGNASSPTAIGMYDTLNNKAIFVYRDYDNYALTQTNIRQHIIEVRPADSSTTSITAIKTWQDVPLKTATMDNGLNPGLDNSSNADKFFEVTTDGKIKCNCKGYVMVSAQVYLSSGLSSGDTVGAAIIKNSIHQAVFYAKSGGSAVDVSVPARVFPVAAGDTIGIQTNNQTAARGTVDKNATRTRLVVQYVG